MIRVQIVLHDINVRAVFARLEAVCLKINGIVGIIEGVCRKRRILRQEMAADGGYIRGVDTAGKQGGDRNVGYHLHTDAVFEQV